ncbi:carbohydrate ABC transporter permease [Paenibacillus sp. SYP-B3998]|uniref:Carbohydrate ABC transporter permease n=1 Tax=Paenibacillus sp. SYP-B3998 TaxID=2678564 RepID=A0A6G3ZSY4_9BACL|nr:carbohydrate ABC transporter permease [Paenibacillus sp. SYP-B3998]NEW04814.1 carbohydrate ABC transporter permease [Paenibacillus sp. SYP-B3998]
MRITSLFRKKLSAADIIILAVLLVLSILMISPFIWMLSISFERTANLQPPFPPSFYPKNASVFNYDIVMENATLFKSYLNSGLVAACVVCLSVSSSLLAGYAFAKGQFKGKKALFLIVLATMMIPMETRLIPLFTMFNKFGLINTFIPLIAPAILYGFGILLCKQYFDQLPDSLREAAQIDGSSEGRTFLQIYVPLTGPIIATLAILSFLESWNAFLWPLVVINDHELRTIPIFLASFSFENGTRLAGLTMALAAASIAPIIVVFLFLQKYIIRSIALSGLKGE